MITEVEEMWDNGDGVKELGTKGEKWQRCETMDTGV